MTHSTDHERSPSQGVIVHHDFERFRFLSEERPVVLPPGFSLPSGDERAKQTLHRLGEIYKRYDGN